MAAPRHFLVMGRCECVVTVLGVPVPPFAHVIPRLPEVTARVLVIHGAAMMVVEVLRAFAVVGPPVVVACMLVHIGKGSISVENDADGVDREFAGAVRVRVEARVAAEVEMSRGPLRAGTF